MCKYCDNKNILKREEYSDINSYGKAEILIEDKNILKLKLQWFDNFRGATMATAAYVDINYCPWCGRKLND